MQIENLRTQVSALMPEMLDQLCAAVAIPSVSLPGYPREPIRDMANHAAQLLTISGAPRTELIEIPHGNPVVYADVPGPVGSPTVVLYAHYDVQPASPAQGWATDPWTATWGQDKRLYGRGVADDKSGLIMHAATLRIFGGHPPVNLKIIIEGEEETKSNLAQALHNEMGLENAAAVVIADMGNLSVGKPAITCSLRGVASCLARVKTLTFDTHSGLFGGPTPDALTALLQTLSSLHDQTGSIVVDKLTTGNWQDPNVDENWLRASAGIEDSSSLNGVGPIASRLWTNPAISVLGIDVPSVDESSNVLHATATAKISIRTAPTADSDEELTAVIDHLRNHRPHWAEIEFERLGAARGLAPQALDSAVYSVAREAMSASFDGHPTEMIGSGGAVPAANLLRDIAPSAATILWGAEDVAQSQIHGPNESIDPFELERMILAQCIFLADMGSRFTRNGVTNGVNHT
ncbi:M20/M25/M40 family metallo-hydrolase [Rhodococcus sp. JS3073]|uniref:M20/M25/M40 family metallo-hydrolase n=1 Tax=Rhodococcus sp. JS3073 TaxID=3002901 RepID=UPI002286BD9A|nr:M20/M25/M40 family metallo-hydrolase [Rhodococcus sp. JS3073]WAM12077.1 M20/M25/M40 family metallo-hydrolase [Rhodococcus sp. JS3073]